MNSPLSQRAFYCVSASTTRGENSSALIVNRRLSPPETRRIASPANANVRSYLAEFAIKNISLIKIIKIK
jgi:hypothetical protein